MVNVNQLPNCFLAGCQKTASTWIYYCLAEHPEVYVTSNDATHYFTINYYKGIEWYWQWYREVKSEKAIFDTTPSYIRDCQAPKRIFEFNPDAKLIFSLRNPIDRAFSHYWHEKHKGKIAFNFDEAIFYNNIGNYDLYSDWISSGFYYELIKNYLEYFDKEQILILIYEDLKARPIDFMQALYRFVGVDDQFVPSALGRVINRYGDLPRPASPALQTKPTPFERLDQNLPAAARAALKIVLPDFMRQSLRAIFTPPKHTNRKAPKPASEYEQGLDPNVRKHLLEIFKPENKKLETLINRDLSFWK